MSQSTLSRELALAIGLAARALADTQPEQLINILAATLVLPLTESKLQSLTLEQYKQMIVKGLQKTYSKQQIKESFTLLKSVYSDTVQQPDHQLQDYLPGDMPHSIRIAMSSKTGYFLDSQFTVCQQYYIYQVSAEENRLIAIRPVEIDKTLKAEKKYQYRAQLIADCQVVYCQSIGGLAASKVIKLGIHPIKLSVPESLPTLIDQLQYILSTSPPPWIAKSMGLGTCTE